LQFWILQLQYRLI